MAITTYSELKTAINEWLDRSETDGKLDEFIDLAESRHARDLRLRDMITRSTASMSTSSRFLALPTDHIQTIRLYISSTTPETTLRQVSPWELVKRPEKSSGKPLYYAVHEEIEFDRTPDSAHTVEIIYYKKFTALSSTDTSNGLLTNHPDIYLSSSLVEAFRYLHDEESASRWDNLYMQRVQEAMSKDKRDQYGFSPLWSQPNGFTP